MVALKPVEGLQLKFVAPVAVKIDAEPEHTTAGDAEAVTEVLITLTVVLELAEQPFEFIAVTAYTPEFKFVTLLTTGFCKLEVNPLGPLHETEVQLPATLRFSALPKQTGELLDAVRLKAAGSLITTVAEAVQAPLPLPFAAEATRLYVPGP